MRSDRTRMVLSAIAALALLAPPRDAGAEQVEVSPVMLELPAGAASTVLTVANRGTQRAAIQVRGFEWRQSPTEDPLSPTGALLISPPLFELEPGETQVVRLLLRAPAGGREASYRLLVDQIPPPSASATVRLSLRLSLPLFAAAAGHAAPDLAWRVLVAGDGSAELSAVNRGQRRERVIDMMLRPAGAAPLRPEPLGNPWILPGAERRWRLPPAALRLAGGQALLTARSDSGPIHATVPVVRLQ